MQYSINQKESYDICRSDPSAPESRWIFLFQSKYVYGFSLPVHLKFTADDWLKRFAASFSQFDLCHLSCNRSAGGTSYVAYQFTSSHMVISITQQRQWNPTPAISNSRYNNSDIRTLIPFNIEERKIHLSSIVSLTNNLFVYLNQLRRLCCLNV